MGAKDFFDGLFRRKKRAEKINLEYPVHWESLTETQFRDVCHILSLPGIGRERALFLCLCKLSGIVPDDPRKYDPRKLGNAHPFIIGGKTYVIGADTIASACRDLAFIFDEVGLPPSPFPQVDRMLYNISFEQYFVADSYILRALAENNDGHLKPAVRKLTDGQVRRLYPWQRKALLIWWNGVKQRLRGMYPHCLKEGSGISDKTQAEILRDLLSSLNENHPQENDKILKTDLHSVLKALDNIYANADKRIRN